MNRLLDASFALPRYLERVPIRTRTGHWSQDGFLALLFVITLGNGRGGSCGFVAVFGSLQVNRAKTHPNELDRRRQTAINAIGAADVSAQFGEVPVKPSWSLTPAVRPLDRSTATTSAPHLPPQ